MAIDLWCDGTDLDLSMPTVSGRKALVQALVRRLVTPQGDPLLGGNGLINDNEYGLGIETYLNSTISTGDIKLLARRIERQLQQDERVNSAAVTVTYTLATGSMRIDISIVDGAGPFSFTVAVDELTVEVIHEGL